MEVSRISPSRKKASVQIAQFIIVSLSVADELQTVLIARNIAGVMGNRSGLGPLGFSYAYLYCLDFWHGGVVW